VVVREEGASAVNALHFQATEDLFATIKAYEPVCVSQLISLTGADRATTYRRVQALIDQGRIVVAGRRRVGTTGPKAVFYRSTPS
jgi:DNA-binding IclR family transcriptional regulator